MRHATEKKRSAWEMFVDKYFAPAVTIACDSEQFHLEPSSELMEELNNSFTHATVDLFENGPSFSSYHVQYNIGGTRGEAIYKSTTTMYPGFCMFDDVEEYKSSFSLHD